MSVINAGSHSVEFWEDSPDVGLTKGKIEHGASTFTQTIRIAWNDIQIAWEDILGIYQVEGSTGGPGTFHRQLPLQYTLFPAAYATSITYEGGYKLDGKYKAVSVGNDVAQYEYAFLTINYNVLPFSVLEDSEVELEYQRYTVFLPVPGAEFIKYGPASILWKYVSTDSGINNGPVNFPLNKILPKGDLQVQWYYVPEDWIFDADTGLPSNFINAVGTVNSATWYGYPAGTLLCMPATFQALNSASPELNGNDTPQRLFNVSVNFKYFQPPTNGVDMGPSGHNWAPGSDGFFYKIVTKNGGNTLYAQSNFDLIFGQV